MYKRIVLILVIIFFSAITLNVSALEEGDYIIKSSLNQNKVIDLSGNNINNCTNIHLYDNNGTQAQIWHISDAGEGYYTISIANNRNYVLDVSGAVFKNNSNVQLYQSNNSSAQKWKIIENENGTYSFLSYDERYLLDVTGAQTANLTNIQLYQSNGNAAQKFYLQKKIIGEKTIEDGLYKIETTSENKALSINNAGNFTKIEAKEYENNENQQWNIRYIGNGLYSIVTNINNNYVLDVSGNSQIPNATVQLYQSNNTDAQKWIIKDLGNGEYSIISNGCSLYLDINNENSAITNIFTDQGTQKFKITKVKQVGTQTIKDGYYFINTKMNTNKSLDVSGGVIEQNRNVQLYDSNNTMAQKWYVKYNGDGYYSILCNKDSNYSLTHEAGTTPNVKISIYDSENDAQKWMIKDLHNGYYSIINLDGLVLDVYGAQTSNGTNIWMYQSNNSNAQQFQFYYTANGLSDNTSFSGYYFIKSALDENFVIDLNSASTNNTNNISLYQKNSSNAQKWELIYQNGYYKIVSSINYNKSMDVSGASTNPKTNVQIYDYNASRAQQWVIKDAGDGYYYIVSACNGLYLESDGAANNFTNLEVNEFTGNQNQKFKLEKTRLENLVIDVSSHNGDINWDQVKNEAGIYGVIIRVASYSSNVDKKLQRNASELARLNIPYGIYIYSYAEDQFGNVSDLGYAHEAELDARRVLKAITDYNLNPTLGIYYDLEVWENGGNSHWTSENYAPLINYFGKTMTNAGYSNWRIYTNLSWANSALSPWKDRITWIAQWNTHCNYDSYYNLWQFSSNGTIPGIEGRVDLNYYYID